MTPSPERRRWIVHVCEIFADSKLEIGLRANTINPGGRANSSLCLELEIATM